MITFFEDADALTKNNKMEPLCTIMGRSDFCEIKGDIRIDGSSYTVLIVSSETDIPAAENTSWRVRPYARKGDQAAMGAVREWTLKLVAGGSDIPQCSQNHSVPGILFSAGGYAGNHFHAFTDIIVPLFSTARPYNGEVQFLITNGWSAWITKFKTILKALSRYELINIDNRKDIHCFGSMTAGLKRPSYKELVIDPSKSPYSIKDFRQFLRSSYSLKKTRALTIRDGTRKRPRLLIISRKRSRAFTNVGEIVNMAKRLGFRVVVAEPGMDVSGFSQIINSCDVVMGVHGAGLTNIVFLPEKAVLIQVIPFGGAEWLSRTFFEEPAKDMNIRYLDYKIKVEESTLIQQYPADHAVLKDPSVIGKQGWLAFQSIYLQKQNVTIDVNRFRPTLVKALELLHQ
ncbi:beta-1,2-xylosyltransferase XYXT1-like isoform X3 [Populus alba x Populus x berolinensis]|nr:beta-1,2-xylosyltransferase XYXT1-like isoform X3 [Populus alba x Populus x berolinensis]